MIHGGFARAVGRRSNEDTALGVGAGQPISIVVLLAVALTSIGSRLLGAAYPLIDIVAPASRNVPEADFYNTRAIATRDALTSVSVLRGPALP